MKKPLNITLGENTVRGLKEEAEKLEISVSAFITMLFKNYQREQISMEIMQQKELFENIQNLIKKELEKEQEGNATTEEILWYKGGNKTRLETRQNKNKIYAKKKRRSPKHNQSYRIWR